LLVKEGVDQFLRLCARLLLLGMIVETIQIQIIRRSLLLLGSDFEYLIF